uniref:Putative Zinc finger family protein n=1 Tax=Davidia involucrata TaxID=16924 RepID=A0A5B7BR01_DAVIN
MSFVKFWNIFNAIQSKRLQTLTPSIALYRVCHFGSHPGIDSSDPSSFLVEKNAQNTVAIFWDLDNKPPKSFPPYDAAVRLKKAAASFGVVRYMVAYANRHAFSYVPPVVREQRKERKSLNQLENKGFIRPAEPYICRVCGRRFYTNDKLVNHFKQIHEREQIKRLNQIESARGKRRVKLVGKFSMKMDKYKSAARDVLTPKVGYGLADELKRAGFWVRTVPDKPQAADIALRDRMVDMMDHRRVDCVVLVSDDSDFVEVLKEAKLRCLKTVVVGDSNDGALKRTADAGYSWQEIMLGKAKKEAVSVVGRWKDRDVLKRLEWTYNPETEKKLYYSDDEADVEREDSEVEGFLSGEDDNCMQKEDVGAWWELGSDVDATSS